MSSWNTVALNDVADIFNGKTPSKAEQRDSGHPVLKIKDVSEFGEFRGAFESFVDSRLAETFAPKQVRDGDTLILNAAHNADYVGSKTYRAQPSTFGSLATGEWLIVRPAVDKLHPGFAHHWVNGSHTRRAIRDLVKGIHLYPKDVARLRIPLPPFPEQRRIAEILDKADALRAKRRVALAQLETLAQSIFVATYGHADYPKPTIGDLLDSNALLLHKDGNHGSLYPRAEDFGDEGIPFLSAKAVTDDGMLDDSRVERLREDKAQRLRIGWIQTGDVLLAHNASVGKVALYDGRFERALIGTSLTAFRPDPKALDSRYLAAALRSSHFQRQLEKNMSQTTRNQVPITAQRALRVVQPPIALQQEFALRIGVVEKLKTAQRASLLELDALIAALEQRAFRGEL